MLKLLSLSPWQSNFYKCAKQGPDGAFLVDAPHINILMGNQLKKLQENLAKDLISLEDNDLVSEQQLAKITDVYAQVYDIISEAVDNDTE